jgi:hypothetical protein
MSKGGLERVVQHSTAGVEKGLASGFADAHCWAPPAQIRASGIPAHGSYLGCLTANRWLGQG